MPRRPSRREIAEEDRYTLARLAAFRRAADVVTAAFAEFPEVRAVSLFGSTARPLVREVPRFYKCKRFGVELLHECKDVDLAVWIDRLDNLSALNRARNRAVSVVHKDGGLGVAHHQVDVFLFVNGWTDYVGRLCAFGQCPKGARDCAVPGCGREPFLKQHEDFTLAPDALAADRAVALYERGRGIVRRAADLDEASRDAATPARTGTGSVGGRTDVVTSILDEVQSRGRGSGMPAKQELRVARRPG